MAGREAGVARAGPSEPVGPRLAFLRRLGTVFRGGATAAAAGVLLLTIGFVALLAVEAGPAIGRYGFALLLSDSWDPSAGAFAAVPAIAGTLLTSGLALLFAVPVALGVALFSSEIGPRRLRAPLAYLLDLGAAIPSIVYGIWGLLVLVPLMRRSVEPALMALTGGAPPFTGPALGSGFLTASVVLAVMVIPTVAALSREALRAVPRSQREAALSLGATRWDATRMAVFRPARPGILGAVMLGFGRAIGETIAVALVIGNIPLLPTSFLSTGVTIPSLLVGSFSDSAGLTLSALVELGLILFGLSVAVNLAARGIVRWLSARDAPESAATRPRRRTVRPRTSPTATGGDRPLGGRPWWPRVAAGRAGRVRRRRAIHLAIGALLVVALGLAFLPLASLVDTAVAQGGAAVVRPSFYTSEPPPQCITNCTLGGIGPAIQGTLLLLGLASLIAVPAGLLTGIYLSEYGRNRFGQAVGLLVDVMTGVPSILIGVFVFTLFLRYDRLDAVSALSGGVALAVLMLPIIARATTTALGTVPRGVREAALALGFPRHRVTLRVVLGSCRPALVTGNLLALGRAGGETAALLLTAGSSVYWFSGLHAPVATLAPFIYDALLNSTGPNLIADAWGAALVLLLIMAVISLAARLALRSAATSEAD